MVLKEYEPVAGECVLEEIASCHTRLIFCPAKVSLYQEARHFSVHPLYDHEDQKDGFCFSEGIPFRFKMTLLSN